MAKERTVKSWEISNSMKPISALRQKVQRQKVFLLEPRIGGHSAMAGTMVSSLVGSGNHRESDVWWKLETEKRWNQRGQSHNTLALSFSPPLSLQPVLWLAKCVHKPKVIEKWKMFPAIHKKEAEDIDQITNR